MLNSHFLNLFCVSIIIICPGRCTVCSFRKAIFVMIVHHRSDANRSSNFLYKLVTDKHLSISLKEANRFVCTVGSPRVLSEKVLYSSSFM
jgi:hypothetical protein